MWRDAAIALSVSNLCFLSVWKRLGYLTLNDRYYVKTLPTINSYAAFIINVLILAAILWAVIRLIRKLNSPLVSGVVKAALAVAAVIFYYSDLLNIVESYQLQMMLRGAIIALTIDFLVRRNFTKMAIGSILIIAPLVFIVISQAAWVIIKDLNNSNKPVYADGFSKISTIRSKSEIPPRVVWLIFDTMGQQVVFDNKRNNAKLLEFNHLRQEAFYAENAVQSGHSTLTAIPSLFIGKKVINADIESPNDLMLSYKGTTDPVSWRSHPSIFSQVQKHRWNAALVGWFHPYSRIYRDQVAFCSWNTWSEKYYDIGSWNNSLMANMIAQILSLQPLQHEQHHIRTYLDIYNNTLRLVSDPRFDLIVAHLPVPHKPYIFNTVTGKLGRGVKQDYLGNLILVDRTLAAIQKVIADKGLAEQTTLVISADHADFPQKGDRSDRVPFIIKLGGQNHPLVYSRPFDTFLTKDLILAIMERRITSEAGIAQWLDRQRQ